MRVRELISRLKKLPPEAVAVSLRNPGYSDLEPFEITSVESKSNEMYFTEDLPHGVRAEIVVID